MLYDIKYSIFKKLSQLSFYALKVSPTGGKSFPGLFFIRTAGVEAIKKVSKDQTKYGSILVTGTNGKTTTTTMIIRILSNDLKLATSVGNNTINAMTTGLLKNKADMGVFEYGIRDIEHGTPGLVCKVIEPIGVVYTNISREHTQVLGVKNSFEDYAKAKKLLSESMMDGIIITNVDDPNTTYIAQSNSKNNTLVYYGLELDDYEEIFEENPVICPSCKKELNYEKHYLNQRGIYNCSCGFKRPEPNAKITKLEQKDNIYKITVEVDVYNYHKKSNISYSVELSVAMLGIHNLYNILTTIVAYTAFTTEDNIKESVESFFESYEFEIPAGRFEILHVDDKVIGVGQGDNGDALKVNSLLMNNYIDDDLEFIYTTPDTLEEEIFEDHCNSINALNPKKLVVMPGRVSVDAAKEYYLQIKDQYDSEFYPIELNFHKRIDKVIDLIKTSECKYIIVSGCGEELLFWDELKNRLKKID